MTFKLPNAEVDVRRGLLKRNLFLGKASRVVSQFLRSMRRWRTLLPRSLRSRARMVDFSLGPFDLRVIRVDIVQASIHQRLCQRLSAGRQPQALLTDFLEARFQLSNLFRPIAEDISQSVDALGTDWVVIRVQPEEDVVHPLLVEIAVSKQVSEAQALEPLVRRSLTPTYVRRLLSRKIEQQVGQHHDTQVGQNFVGPLLCGDEHLQSLIALLPGRHDLVGVPVTMQRHGDVVDAHLQCCRDHFRLQGWRPGVAATKAEVNEPSDAGFARTDGAEEVDDPWQVDSLNRPVKRQMELL